MSEHRKIFKQTINRFSAYGYSCFNVFSDFLHLFAISLNNQSDPYHLLTDVKTFNRREDDYKRIIGKYKPEVQEFFPQMATAVICEMQTYCPDDFCDVLGELFHELEFTDDWNGQFFTPKDVCNAMGLITFANSKALQAEIDSKGFVTVNDSACGGGATLLGAANALSKLGFNPQKHMLIICNDIDERCVHMCFIQLSLYGLPAIVFRQNTLTLETFDVPWYTPIFTCYNWQMKMHRTFKAEPTIEPKPTPIIELQPASTFEQLSLF